MIEISQISKMFLDGEKPVIALQPTTLQIKEKEFVIVVGANGSGKSTLLNIIAGTLLFDEGNISVDGNDISALKEHERSRFIARVFQNPQSGTASDLTIIENFRLATLRTQSKNLQLGIDRKFIDSIRERVSWLNLGLEDRLNRKMGALSGGQRQALTVLMSTMDDFKLLLMDEPTAALDPKSAELIMKLTTRILNQMQVSVLMVTHQTKQVIDYGNRVIQMASGQIIRDLDNVSKEKLTLNEIVNWFD
ncbi:MAG TPA: ATP-binding cassette domain-containing protein [Bacteroidia bacterium]|jgi:putative ABC transport system ATP-binding protein|nr:ATP-binding cassette domain-containing protein [Bacteroidia bacterium]HMU19305.1 ATP-binding cassette domain-containing protein [Bacteroidia bacterium]